MQKAQETEFKLAIDKIDMKKAQKLAKKAKRGFLGVGVLEEAAERRESPTTLGPNVSYDVGKSQTQ